MRLASEAAKARKTLEIETGLHDPDMLHDLDELGFTPETIMSLPLVPMLEVAWAESGVSAAERKAILELAHARGLVDGSVADRQLKTWLEQRPSAETFRKARRLIGAIVDHVEPGRTAMTADELLKYLRSDRARVRRPLRHRFGVSRRAGGAAANRCRIEEEIAITPKLQTSNLKKGAHDRSRAFLWSLEFEVWS